MTTLTLIACIDSKNGIGLDGSIPWSIKEDLRHFAQVTKGKWLISGRRTWESIPDRSGAGMRLPGRFPVVITSKSNYVPGQGVVASSLVDAMALIPVNYPDDVIVIGGAIVYEAALPYASKIYLTELDRSYGCDRFFPTLEDMSWQVEHVGNWERHASGVSYRFKRLSRNELSRIP